MDAFAFAFLASAATPIFDMALRPAVEAHGAFMPYVQRMAARFYPEHQWWWRPQADAA